MAIYRVTFTGTHYGSITCQNVVTFKNQDGTLTEAQAAAELRDNWCTLLAAGQTTQFGWRNISVKNVDNALSPYNLPVVVNGVDASDASSAVPVITQKFRIHTPVAGRAGRGRIYLPGYRQAYWNQGILTATGITNMTVRLNAITARYVGALPPSGLQLGILKRNGTGPDFIACDFLSLSNTPGVQRRRNVGVGI